MAREASFSRRGGFGDDDRRRVSARLRGVRRPRRADERGGVAGPTPSCAIALGVSPTRWRNAGSRAAAGSPCSARRGRNMSRSTRPARRWASRSSRSTFACIPRNCSIASTRARPSLLIASGPLASAAASIRDRARLRARLDRAGDGARGGSSYEGLLAKASAREPPRVAEPEDIHNVLFTSGTTGRPKGAMISQRAAAIRGLRLAQWFRLDENDGFVGWLPLYHCGGDESLYATMVTGGVFCALRKADAATMFRVIARDRLSWTLLLPGVLTDFLNHPRRGDHDLSSLRFAIGYANMMPDIVARADGGVLDRLFRRVRTERELLSARAWRVSVPGETPSLRKRPFAAARDANRGRRDERLARRRSRRMRRARPERHERLSRRPRRQRGGLSRRLAAYRRSPAQGGRRLADLRRSQEISDQDRRRERLSRRGRGGDGAPSGRAGSLRVRRARSPLGRDDQGGHRAPRQGQSAERRGNRRVLPRTSLAGYKRPRLVEFVASERMPRSATGKLQRHELAKWPIGEDQKV